MSRNKQTSGNRTQAIPNTGQLAQVLHESTSPQATTGAPEEERISLFWRVFGGTILSIAALVVVTVYQQFSTNLNDLRAAVNHVTENQVDLVKKEDLAGRTSTLWSSLQAVSGDVPALKTRLAVLETQLQNSDKRRRDLERQLQTLRERLVVLEARRSGGRHEEAEKPDNGD